MEGAFLFALIGLGLLEGNASEPNGAASSRCRGFYLWLALLIALICIAYAPSLAIHFQYQDWDFRLASSAIHSWHDASELFTKPQADGFYRPLTFVSLLADYRVFGDHAWGYHLQNIAFHIVNCVLLLVLARTLGFAESVARWAAVLFAVAAVNFEPVLWPAARFDLTATTCTLLAWIFALRYLNGDPVRNLAFSAIALGLGILNKESAYCFPLVIGCIVFFRRPLSVGSGAGRSRLSPESRTRRSQAATGSVVSLEVPLKSLSRGVKLAVVTFAVMAVMILVRLAVLGGFGGYPSVAASDSPHYVFTLKTLTSLFTRLPVGLLGINTSVTLPVWLIAAIALFALVLVAAVLVGARAGRTDLVLLLCALLTALPTLNIINWIGEPMQQARYLYMPGVWLALFVASVLGSRQAWSVPLLVLWAGANLAGLEHNLNVYRSTLSQTRIIGERVRQDSLATPGARVILIKGLPDQPNGVFFAASEVISQMKAAFPGAVIERDGGACPDLSYRWNPSTADLMREPVPAACSGAP